MDPHRSPLVDGEPSVRPQRVPLGEAAAWGTALVATVIVAAAAGAAGVVLTVFGLGGVVLAAVALLTLAGATVWRRGLRRIAVVALAVALPAAWAAHGSARIDRTRGTLVVTPRTPADVARAPYRRGMGSVLVGLRRLHAPNGSTTDIAARADTGRVVVALPTDRCFNLDVQFSSEVVTAPASLATRVVRALSGDSDDGRVVSVSSLGLTAAASAADSKHSGDAALAAFHAGNPTLPYGLLAFNRWASAAGTYTRVASGQPGAPTLRLDLRAPAQIVVRDYPSDVDPLQVNFPPAAPNPIGGTFWPEGLPAPVRPTDASTVRTPANRARWIVWEQRLVTWAKAQARRAAGPCASRADLRGRGFSFLTQPETVRKDGTNDRLVGDAPYERSSIPQATADADDAMLGVEVNGLGETRLLGPRPGAANEASVVSP